jgi:hypothetical protein
MQVHQWAILDWSRLLPFQRCVVRPDCNREVCLQSGFLLERQHLSKVLWLMWLQHGAEHDRTVDQHFTPLPIEYLAVHQVSVTVMIWPPQIAAGGCVKDVTSNQRPLLELVHCSDLSHPDTSQYAEVTSLPLPNVLLVSLKVNLLNVSLQTDRCLHCSSCSRICMYCVGSFWKYITSKAWMCS